MNHAYRVVWNASLGVWQAASEIARASGKGARVQLLATLLLPAGLMAAWPAQAGGLAATALPVGGAVTAGAGRISRSGTTLTVSQQTPNLSLDWRAFNIGRDARVNFVQPGAQSVAVNRIGGNTGSVILGQLNANGQVYLINPNGIVFGRGAQVNVGGLVASTLDVGDGAVGSSSQTFGGGGTGSVVNRGTITAAPGGYVALLGNRVANEGLVSARLGSVALAGGSAVTLSFDSNRLVDMQVQRSTFDNLAKNGQLIEADGGQVWMTAGAKDSLLASAVNNTGTVRAQTVGTRDGKIVLLSGMDAGTTDVSGTLDASAPGAGSGGSVETSGARVRVADGASVTTRSATGQPGAWLIDPTDFTITSGTVASTASGIGATTLEANLANGAVTIQTASAGTEDGDIDVDAAVNWSSGNALTLSAAHDINVNASLAGAGAAVSLSAGLGIAINGTVTVSASTLALNAATGGIGGTGALVAGTLSGSAHNDVALDGANAVGVLGGFSVAEGSFSLTDAEALTVNGSLSAQNITLATRSGNLDLNSAIAATGTLSLTAAGGIGQSGGVLNATTLTGSSEMDANFGSANNVIGTLAHFSAANLALTDTTALTLTGTIATTGNQTYDSPVTLAESVVLTGANIALNDGVSGAGAALTIDGNASFGGSSSLAALSVSGSTALAGSITTTGAQSYGGAVTLAGASTLNSTGGGAIGFDSTVDGNESLTVSTAGPVTFGGAVGGQAAPADLTVNGSSLATFAGTVNSGMLSVQGPALLHGDVTTTGGPQQWGGAVTPGADIALTGAGDITFDAPVSGTHALNVSSTGGDVAFDGPVALNGLTVSGDAFTAGTLAIGSGGLSVTTASGPIDQTGPFIVAGNSSFDAGSRPITLTNPGNDFGGAVNLTGGAANVVSADTLTLGQVDVATLVAQSAGDLAIAAGGSITATGSGNALVLVDGGRFVNAASGQTALSTPNGRWLIWSQNPGLDTPGNLAYAFKQYDASYDPSLSALQQITPGNGLLYTFAPVVTVGLTGQVQKTYDGTTAATLGNANYSTAGVQTGDTVTLAGSGIGTYDTADAGTGKTVAVSGLSIAQASDNGVPVYGYQLQNTDASAAIGTIAPLTLTAALTGTVSKTYDGSTAATLGADNYVLAGVLGNDAVSLVGPVAATYASAKVGSAIEVTASGFSLGGAAAGNYRLDAGAVLTAPIGAITPAALTVTALDQTKTYGQSLNPGTTAFTASGLVSGDTVTGVNLASDGAASAANAGAYAITAGGASGNGLSNYTISYVPGLLTVNPALLGVALTGTISKTYDGTTVAMPGAGNYVLTGVIGSDAVSVATTGSTYASANAGTGITVTASGLTLTGTAAANYTLDGNTTVSGAVGTIVPATLTVTGTTVESRTYDGTTAATLTGGTLAGVIGSDNVTLAQGGSFVSPNAGPHVAVMATDTLGGGASGNYVLEEPTGLSGTIAPAILTYVAGQTSSIYGATPGALGGTVTGFVAGQTLADATTGTPVWTTPATAASPTGRYAVDGGGLGANYGNYVFAQAPGNATALAIDPAALTIAALNQTKTYGQNLAPGATAFTASGLVNGDTVTGVNFASDGAAPPANVGAYAIAAGGASGSGLSNYTIRYLPGTLTVTPATLTYVAAPAHVWAGLAPSGLDGTVTGFVNGDTLDTATAGTPVWSTRATAGSPAGRYAVEGGGLAAHNYVFVQAPANAAALTVSLDTAPAPVTNVTAGLQRRAQTQGTVVAAAHGAQPPLPGMPADLSAPALQILAGGVRLP